MSTRTSLPRRSKWRTVSGASDAVVVDFIAGAADSGPTTSHDEPAAAIAHSVPHHSYLVVVVVASHPRVREVSRPNAS